MAEQNNEYQFEEVKAPRKTSEVGVEASQTEQLGKLNKELAGLQEAISHNQPISLELLDRAREALDNTELTIGGEKIKLKDLKELPYAKDFLELGDKINQVALADFLANKNKWEQLMADPKADEADLTFIPADVAQKLVESRGGGGRIRLDNVSYISPKVADILGGLSGGRPYLRRLKELSPEAAEGLSKQGGRLELGMPQITPAAAEAISKHLGELTLYIKGALLTDVAKALSGSRGDLILSGITELSDQAAEALSHKPQRFLALYQLEKISDKGIKALSRLFSLGTLSVSREIKERLESVS